MIRIVFIITGLRTGGAESALYRLLKHFPDGADLRVISLSDYGEIGPRIAALGIPVEALQMHAGSANVLNISRLVRRLREIKPDIVQTWMYHADMIGGLAARLASVPAIIWGIRNSNLEVRKTKWTTRAVVQLCATLLRRVPTGIVSCSDRARQIHIALGYVADGFVVIPNGIELASFRPNPALRAAVRAELHIPTEAPLIGMIARFDPQKNHRGFFDAARLIHARRPDVHFLLAGPGIDEANADIRRWRDEANVTPVTRVLGLRNDVPRLMAALDIASSASSWGEAFPNVLAEAMACGVPCVATDVGDSAYIVGNTGRVVAAGDMPGLAAEWLSLLELSRSERDALGRQARARVEENFDIQAMAHRYAAFYEKAANSHA